MLPSQRHLFDIPDDIVYLNCAYMSPLPRSVREVGEKAVARKAQPWNIYTRDFFEDAELARHLFAQLVNGNAEDAEGVALIPAASYGLSIAASNLTIEQDQRIVLLDEQFPSNVYPWHELARRQGAVVDVVKRPDDGNWTDALLQRIDERVRIVAVPNCHWTDGGFIDLVRVSKRTHEVGAALVVDATQSLGAYPFDIRKVAPDFLVTAAYKWLLGPYSIGFLYVAPQHRQGTPIEFGWIGRADSEDFSQLVNYRSTFQPGARRFDVGERSNFILLPMVVAALKQLLDWGVPAIDETLREMTGRIEREAAQLGFQTVANRYRIGNIIGLRHTTTLPTQLASELMKANVFVSIRGQSIRVSPHLYNTSEDIDRFVQALATSIHPSGELPRAQV